MAAANRPAGALSGLAGALVFFAFVAAGSAYVVWAKLAGLPAAFVTLVPVAVMVAYAVVSVVLRPAAGADDQTGDNAYYMGFLFTLTSLAVSLWQFDADGEAEAIVRNFGVAIASTIAGIAIRVFVNQLRRDPAGIERGTRADLADAARRVRRELDATVMDLGHFRRGTQQAATESWTAVRAEVAENARALAEEMREATRPMRRAAGRSGEAFEALAARLETLSASLDAVTRRLDGTAAGTARPDAPAPASAEAVAAAVEALAGHLDRHGARLEALSAELASLERRLAATGPAAPPRDEAAE
jgi:hypothetical protein